MNKQEKNKKPNNLDSTENPFAVRFFGEADALVCSPSNCCFYHSNYSLVELSMDKHKENH